MVMKYIRLIFRKIKSSKARFFSIAAIFALGVGFFSGLGSTMPVMKNSMDKYADSYGLYDIRLMSEYGFEDSDAELIGSVSGVEKAVLSKSADALADGGAVRFMSLTDGINGLRLLEGRLPSKPGECVLGRNKMSGNLAALGETVKLSDDNSEDTLGMFKTREFTVVGIAESPVFPSVQRGAATVGQGALHHFAYILSDDFDTDYYTEAYIKVGGAAGQRLYSDGYNSLIDTAAENLKNSELSEHRLESIKNSAGEELDRSRAEYETQRERAERELSDAKAALDSANSKLLSAKKQISAGEAELERGAAEYSAAKAGSEKKLSAARAELAEKEAQYTAALSELERNYVYLEAAFGKDIADMQTADARAQLDLAKVQLEAGKTELSNAEDLAAGELDTAGQKLADSRAQLESAKRQYQSGLSEYNKGLSEYNLQKSRAENELADAHEQLLQAELDIENMSAPEIYVMTLEDNYGVNAFSQDADRINNIAKVFPIMFFVVAALVCLTTMTRMIDEQRTKIGTLSALGYGRGAIAFQYLAYSGISTLIGSAFGILIGNTVIPLIIFNTYKILYSVPDIVLTVDAQRAAVAVVSALLLTALVTLWAAYDSLRACAAQLMRPAAPKSGKKVILEHIGFLWKRLSFTSKVTCRNILRYKKRFFMTVFGIAGCCALLLTGFGLRDSISGMLPKQYGKIQSFDMTVFLAKDSESVRQCIADNSDDSLFVQSMSTDAKSDSGSLECYVLVPQEPSKLPQYIDLHERVSGGKTEFPDFMHAVIAEKLSEKLKIGIGDTISVKRPEGGYAQLTVSGITENYIYNYVYMSPQTYESVFEKAPQYNQAYVKTDDPESAGAAVTEHADAASVMNSKDMMTSFSEVFDSLNGVVLLLIVSACLLNFVVLYNLTNINIGERVREIATIKVLGFYPHETDAYIYRENIVLTAVGTALGLFIGRFLHGFVMTTAEIDMIMFARDISVWSYIFSALLTFAFSALVNVFMHFKLMKISMTESLKSIE